MKLKMLSEYLVGYEDGLKFYGDPAGKVTGTNETTFLTHGERDREEYIKAMYPGQKKKKKKKKGKK